MDWMAQISCVCNSWVVSFAKARRVVVPGKGSPCNLIRTCTMQVAATGS
jgi:hypothetical protein